MQQYQNVLQDKFGNVIVGASVAVYVYGTTTPATIYSGNGTGLLPSNTVTTSSLGEFSFYAANGRYSLSITATNFVAESYSDFILYDPADIGAVTASSVAFTPFGTVAATNVQNAIQEVVADLAGASGSSLVGFLQSGTGAQATTVQAKLRETVSVKDFGAVGDGIADDTAAIQAALDYGATSGITVIASGTFKITSKVTIKGNADFSDATINVYGTPAIALEISTGNTANPTTILYNAIVRLPKLIANMTKPVTGWAGQGIGVRTVNTYACQITVGNVRGFANGLLCTSYGTGSVFNSYYLGNLENNQVNLQLEPGNAGAWVNSNTYIGGTLSFESAEGVNVAGCYDINIANSTNVVNNNLFVNQSIEGDTPEFHVRCAGSYNTFQQSRWEATTPKLQFFGTSTNNATRNMVLGGYTLENIVVSYSGTTGKDNVLFGAATQVFEMGTSSKPLRYQNVSSSASAISRIYESGLNPWANGTDWSVSESAQALQAKRAADVYARLVLDYVNARMYVGDGVAAATAYIGALGASTLGCSASVWPTVDNTNTLGDASYRWNNAYSVNFRPGAGTATWTSGAGTPEGAVTATVGSLFTRTNGGAGTTLYIKESGTGNTGWVAK